jgi:hypothetical protein
VGGGGRCGRFSAAEEERLERHRDFVERVVATWPDDAPYPASDVRLVMRGEY